MNGRISKLLRMEAGFHPAAKREYLINQKGTIIANPSTARSRYKKLKVKFKLLWNKKKGN